MLDAYSSPEIILKMNFPGSGTGSCLLKVKQALQVFVFVFGDGTTI